MGVPIESLDRLTAMFGERGTGKSTELVLDAMRFQREVRGGYVIMHSPDARLPMKLPDGSRSPIEWHDSVKDLEGWRGLSRRPHLIHVVVGGDPEPVIDYGRRLAKAIKIRAIKRAGFHYRDKRPIPMIETEQQSRRAGQPIGEKVAAEPVYVGIDEGTAIQHASKGSDELHNWQVFLTGLRHENMALTWSIQSPNARNYAFIEQANIFITYRYMMEWGLNTLRARGVPAEDLQIIAGLPNYQRRMYHFSRK